MYKLMAIALVTILVACKKQPAAPPVVMVPERLELTPTAANVESGNSTIFTAKYYNNIGALATTPASLVWSSSNIAIATVNTTGTVTGVSAGQATIKAKYNNIEATALITVTNAANQIAAVNITPSGIVEILKNQTTNLTATAVNTAGGVISGLTYTWTTSNSNQVPVSSTGMVTGLAYGSVNVTATANSIMSAPSMVQVIRKGAFSGSGSTGFAKLKMVNNVLQLETTSDFSINTAAPDLRLYLTNTPTASNIAGAVQVADLAMPSQYSGAHTFNIAAPTTITDYRYVIVWCAQFGGNYGTADLGL
jgi:hypothetical protein